MIEKAYGKINISLDIVGKRSDGYHELDMIMVPVGIYDTLYLKKDKEMSFVSNCSLRWDESNLIYKAVMLMKKTFSLDSNYSIRLIKRIPEQAGMAGGSADCAAVMRLINKVEKLCLSREELAGLGVKLGADVPFCIYQEAARVKGIGEKIRALPEHEKYDVVIIKPDKGVSTAAAFKMADEGECLHPGMDKVEELYLSHGELETVMGNSLQQPAISMLPEIEDILNECKKAGFTKSLMTGSGSAVFALVEKHQNVTEFIKRMKKKYKFTYKTQII